MRREQAGPSVAWKQQARTHRSPGVALLSEARGRLGEEEEAAGYGRVARRRGDVQGGPRMGGPRILHGFGKGTHLGV